MHDDPQCSLTDIICKRQTWKVLGDPSDPVRFSSDVLKRNDQLVITAIANAGWAPFHYDRNVNNTPEPWRAYLLEAATCRTIAGNFLDWFDDAKPNNKLAPMLAACGSVVLVTWIPQFRSLVPQVTGDLEFENQTNVDDEHLAATAAMVQNLLLLLTAEGLGTYWSSGGQLGSREMFRRLEIDCSEKLLAAVFVEYPGGQGPIKERIPGKLRDRRSPATSWFRVATCG